MQAKIQLSYICILATITLAINTVNLRQPKKTQKFKVADLKTFFGVLHFFICFSPMSIYPLLDKNKKTPPYIVDIGSNELLTPINRMLMLKN
jgi:hypothetical protein